MLASLVLCGALAGCLGSGGGGDSAAAPSGAPGASASASPNPAPGGSGSGDTVAPSTPVGLTAMAVSPAQVGLSWTPSTDNVGVTGYRVMRNGTQVATATSAEYTVGGLSPSTSYSFTVQAQDAAGNLSAQSASASATTPAASANVVYGNPTNYQTLLAALKPGDTLVLEPGDYDSDPPGLPIFGLNGTAGAPITIKGDESQPRPVLLGRSTHNTIRFANSSYVVVKHIEVNGRDLGGDGVNNQGVSHNITLEGLVIRGVGSDQQIVGISTNGATAWNWVIRGCEIVGAGTGLYLGNSDGNNPFIAGLIERNLIRETIGYNMQIKHQNVRPSIAGMPTAKSSTVIRHNVFHKTTNSSTGGNARPNLLVGALPPSGPGTDDVYEIYGNFFYQNPTEALFQGEGNIALHHNLFVNASGSAVVLQPHNGLLKMARVFHNTVVATGNGISVSGGAAGFTQKVIGNAVFAATPINAADQQSNITGAHASAGNFLVNPTGAPGQLDLFPKTGMLVGAMIDTSSFNTFLDWDRDFNGGPQGTTLRGAYGAEGNNPGWKPTLAIKP